MNTAPRLVFALQLLSTCSMFGVIWFVQLAHYPGFAEVGPASFTRYEAAYANRMGYVAGPLMLAELLSSLLLLVPSLRLPLIASWEAWFGVSLAILLWASTVFIQIPLHNQLHITFDPKVIHRLVLSNWIRTAAWTGRAVLVLIWVNRLISTAG